jgi:lipopolysaccharide export system permease protein
MSIINRYLRREILLPFFYSLLVIIFILLLGNLFKIVSMVVSEGVKLWDVIRLVTAMIPQMMTIALPLAFFFAVLAGIGRLVGDGEITALEAAGISPYQLLQPILQLAAVCTMLTMLMSAWLAPWGMRQVRRVTFTILQDKVTLALRPRVLNLAFPGMTIYLCGIDRKSGRLLSIFIEDRRNRKLPQTITALYGRLVSDMRSSTLSLQLKNGTIHEYDPEKESYRVTDFQEYKVNFAISALLGDKLHVGMKNKSMSNSELWLKIKRKRKLGLDHTGALANLFERFSQPFACFAFALLGLALALKPIRSEARAKGFVWGLSIVLSYHVSNLIVDYLTGWKPEFALVFFFLPNLIFIALGLGLITAKQHGTSFSLRLRHRQPD